MANNFSLVTGGLSYTGKYIVQELLRRGKKVKILTGHPNRENPFGNKVEVLPFRFDDYDAMVKSFEGVETFYNTYWIRFSKGKLTFEKAVEHIEVLVRAAKQAGVKRIIHLSVINADADSSLPYFKGKNEVEKLIMNSGISYTILRPTLIFGGVHEEILINNITWMLKHFPLFVIPGSGEYKVQPVFVEDIAKFAVDSADQKKNIFTDMAGPEIYTYNELIRFIAQQSKSRALIVHLPRSLTLFFSWLIGLMTRDVVLTNDEAKALMESLLVSHDSPTAATKFGNHLQMHHNEIGMRYANELARHY